jgi:Uma2 family endonuclease
VTALVSDPEAFRPLRRDEYDKLVDIGAFKDERIELLEGVLLRMSPHGPLHDGTVERLTRVLFRSLDPRAAIRVQSAVAAGDGSEPEPDLAVVPPGDYCQAHPNAAWLIVEVADSSLDRDRGIKARVYAAMDVPEYWVVNVADRCVEVHAQPGPTGYGSIVSVGVGKKIRLRHFPEIEIAVDDIVG